MCFHILSKGEEEETVNEIVEKKPAKTNKRKSDDLKTQIHKKTKQDNVSFPSIEEMNASIEISLEKLPKNEVYEIIKADKRDEIFKGTNP